MARKGLHPLIPEAQEALRKGEISRRDFVRLSTLLGVSLAGAQALAACAPQATPTEQSATTAPGPTTVAATPMPAASPAAPTPVRGGTLRVARRLDRIDDPARFSLVSQAHPWRHVFDYLTRVDAKGVVHPYLLDKWEASDDLKTWTLYIRQGIKFNNGQPLTADDVLFNFERWLSDEVGSSLLGMLSYMDPNGLEKVDDYKVICHLKSPTIDLPYVLWQYNACIVPRSFGGDVTREPIGTGAFLMKEYAPGERCRLVRREDYWRMGTDGNPLPYLDEIVFVQLGDDRTPDLAALQTGQVDTVPEPTVDLWQALSGDENFRITSVQTSATRLLRVRADQEPWTDARVRRALKYCHNREKILAVALRGQGVIGNDSHVAPAMVDYCDSVEPYPFDTAQSKALLAEAGYPDGIKFELTVANSWPEAMAYAQVLKEDALAGGFDISIKPLPPDPYWAGWTDFNASISWWAHRPLAPMLLASAYTRDSTGKLVPWNESHWADDEFESLLKKAQGTLDVEARRTIMCDIETIMKERGAICTPFWMNVWTICNKKVHGIESVPEEYAIYHEAWIEKA